MRRHTKYYTILDRKSSRVVIHNVSAPVGPVPTEQCAEYFHRSQACGIAFERITVQYDQIGPVTFTDVRIAILHLFSAVAVWANLSDIPR